jgi:hypothetical protein
VSAQESAAGREARLFSPAVVAWMVLVGVFAFSALLVLQAYAPDLRSSQDGRAHALSKSAVGYAGLVELLKARGDQVLISRGPVHDQGSPGVIVLTPPPDATLPEVQKLAFQSRPALLVLPKWLAAPDPLHPGWVRKFDALPLAEAAAPAAVEIPKTLAGRYSVSGQPVIPDDDSADNAPAEPAGALRLERDTGVGPLSLYSDDLEALTSGASVGPVDRLQTVSGEGWIPIVTDARGRGLVVKRRDWPLYVLSDPDLLNTQGLKRLDTARGAAAVLDGLRSGAGPVVFDVTLAGFKRPRSLLKLAFQPPFLALTLLALTAAALMGWHAAVRFGPAAAPGRAFALGKRALADNSAALIRLAGREPPMAARYAAVERSAAARMAGAPKDLSPEALDALLDRLGETRGADARFSELREAAERVTDRAGLMDVAKRLHRWRTEMTRERR